MFAVSSVRADSGVLYDAVLLGHVAVGFLGFLANLVTCRKAQQFLSDPSDASCARYFDGTTNFAGRSVLLVPILGVALVIFAHQSADLAEVWFQIAVSIWTVLAVGCAVWVWPLDAKVSRAISNSEAPTLVLCRSIRIANGFGYVIAVGYCVAFYLMLFKPGR